MKIEKILVPVDFSNHSEAALQLALGLVETFDAKLQLVHVIPESRTMPPPYVPSIPADFGITLERAAKVHLNEWRRKYCPAELKVEISLSAGSPSRRIVDLAHEFSVDLIVMGTRGATGLEHFLMGSVAERTVRSAPCPVLTTHDGTN